MSLQQKEGEQFAEEAPPSLVIQTPSLVTGQDFRSKQEIDNEEDKHSEEIMTNPDGTPMYSIRRLKRFVRKTQARYSYTCMVGSCRRTFNNLSEMQLHQRSHQKLRPFKCPHCPKLYTQKGNMVKHRRSHLIPNLDDRRRFICEFCHKGYTEKYNLKTHQKKFHLMEFQNRLRTVTFET